MDKKRITELKHNIANCDLSELDKETLLKLLSDKNITLKEFTDYLMIFLRISKQTLKLFDLDLGDD